MRWFPSVATIYDSMSLGEKLNAIALPVTVLTLVVLAHMMRMTRAAILNVMQSAYIETAELKGLSHVHGHPPPRLSRTPSRRSSTW